MNERDREIHSVEYSIRKLERGIKISHKCRTTLSITSTDYYATIKIYVKEIKELRDRLEKLTGRRSPSIPKWPV